MKFEAIPTFFLSFYLPELVYEHEDNRSLWEEFRQCNEKKQSFKGTELKKVLKKSFFECKSICKTDWWISFSKELKQCQSELGNTHSAEIDELLMDINSEDFVEINHMLLDWSVEQCLKLLEEGSKPNFDE